MPLQVEEYNIGQLYNVVEMSKENIGTKVKIEHNDDHNHPEFGFCRKTVKKMDLSSHLPSVITFFFPSKLFKLEETSFNSYPECRTFYKSCFANESTFNMSIHSKHLEGIQENVFGEEYEIVDLNLGKKILDKRFNVFNFQNEKSKKIFMTDGWLNKCKTENIPFMTCHKLISLELNCIKEKWLAEKVFGEINNFFIKTHQRIYATADDWYNLKMEDIRKLENDTFLQK
ncbi:Phosphatidylinositol transfer protein [Tubulinosema ratisbonensis]|uniref:Phosphatidylinositol transfer protein n=1 Tax=Tubulinosema ratisbonensis TaxID=291195 RepID=A0A437AMB5_9MICR|nr:Phosphatidylinositol transfer protein [Tubulinosema ratisbonensis]